MPVLLALWYCIVFTQTLCTAAVIFNNIRHPNTDILYSHLLLLYTCTAPLCGVETSVT